MIKALKKNFFCLFRTKCVDISRVWEELLLFFISNSHVESVFVMCKCVSFSGHTEGKNTIQQRSWPTSTTRLITSYLWFRQDRRLA